jgi:hypothetical protein
MRTAAALIVLVQLIFFLPLLLIYGQADPCRALAKEISWRADAAGGLGVTLTRTFGDLEIDARRDVAEYSEGQCVAKLFTSWSERITGTQN